MLHFETIEPGTLDLLRRLMAEPLLAEFYLVDGTALALHFGHRLSVDLDLFRDDGFETRTVAENLSAFPGFVMLREARNTLTLELSGVKVDLISHQYPRLQPVRTEDTVRLLELPDLALSDAVAAL